MIHVSLFFKIKHLLIPLLIIFNVVIFVFFWTPTLLSKQHHQNWRFLHFQAMLSCYPGNGARVLYDGWDVQSTTKNKLPATCRVFLLFLYGGKLLKSETLFFWGLPKPNPLKNKNIYIYISTRVFFNPCLHQSWKREIQVVCSYVSLPRYFAPRGSSEGAARNV